MKFSRVVAYCIVSLGLGFALGTEYQKKSSLKRDTSDLPGLQLDLAIYSAALSTLTDVIERSHVEMKIVTIESQIARAKVH